MDLGVRGKVGVDLRVGGKVGVAGDKTPYFKGFYH